MEISDHTPDQTPDQTSGQTSGQDENFLDETEVSRREFLATAVAAGVLAGLPSYANAAKTQGAASSRSPKMPPVEVTPVEISINVNGKTTKMSIEPRTTLLDLLREQMGLTGSKKGCDHGQCGACTVLVNGKRINSCLSLAAQANGKTITTIEGLAKGEELHPMQAAFIEHDAFQCGFCTPGQIMSAVGLLTEPCGKSQAETRECMSGNLCRCGAYRNILDAVQSVRGGGSNAAV